MTHPAVISYVHSGKVSQSFSFCITRMMVHEIGRSLHAGYETLLAGDSTELPMPAVPSLLAQRCGSGGLVDARNEVVAAFLDHHDADWLFCVDDDMGFAADTLESLIASADPAERPVVGALCFGLKRAGDHNEELQSNGFQQFPTVYLWREDAKAAGFQVVKDYPRNAMVECDASGAACFVAHRSVLEAMRAEYGDHWFDQLVHPTPPPNGTKFGEDLSFFVRVHGCGFPVFVNTAIKTSHDKGGVFLTEETWDAQQSLVDPLDSETWARQPA